MDNSIWVHVLKWWDDLAHEVSDFFHGKFFALLNHLAEGFIGAEFQYDIDIFLIFKDTVELNNMLMM